MVESVLEVFACLFDEAVFFWGGGVAFVVGVLWLAVYAGSQFELADVQACQAHGQCVVTTEKGVLNVTLRHLTPAVSARAPAAAAVPAGK